MHTHTCSHARNRTIFHNAPHQHRKSKIRYLWGQMKTTVIDKVRSRRFSNNDFIPASLTCSPSLCENAKKWLTCGWAKELSTWENLNFTNAFLYFKLNMSSLRICFLNLCASLVQDAKSQKMTRPRRPMICVQIKWSVIGGGWRNTHVNRPNCK